MDNPWKLAIYGTQDKEKQNKIKQKHNTICVKLDTTIHKQTKII